MSEVIEANKALIEKFYTAFGDADAATMQSCYHADIVFEDPAFGVLNGSVAGDMWEMLLSGPKFAEDGVTRSLKIEFSDVIANETSGSAKWVAYYKFSGSGRPVENRVHASFEFKDGLIAKHTDVFDFWKWSSQALGNSGYFLGWTSFLKGKVNGQANGKLKNFIKKKYATAEETATSAVDVENVPENNAEDVSEEQKETTEQAPGADSDKEEKPEESTDEHSDGKSAEAVSSEEEHSHQTNKDAVVDEVETPAVTAEDSLVSTEQPEVAPKTDNDSEVSADQSAEVVTTNA